MPELPEVETIKLGLQKYLIGKNIEDVETLFGKTFQGNPKDIIGATVKDIRRFGKGLVIDLDNELSLVIHLKMTGQLIYQDTEMQRGKDTSKKGLPNNWTRVVFKLTTGHSGKVAEATASRIRESVDSGQARMTDSFLYFNDIRKFGWMKIVKSEKLKDLSFFKNLGPEPLNSLDILTFANLISKSKTNIKSLLMDQRKIAGIGNIYACDALFVAKIMPTRRADSLSVDEIKILYEAILTVLRKSIKEGGASERNFINVEGGKGNYQNHMLVYGKAGEPCKTCGTKIKRTVIGGRGTFYCPVCQR